ncbi:MAG TPA: hypothetical protein VFB66_10125 [Tepidisphaeraceae bacterium]|nr:hypothetical protein [Tepidisphaeraceae bacterium]
MQLSLVKTVAFWVCLALAGLSLGTVYRTPTHILAWKDRFQDNVTATVGALLLAAVLVERVVEVFLSIWKRPEVDHLEQSLEFQQAVQVDRRSDITALDAKIADQARSADEKAVLKAKRDRKEMELADAEDAAEELERQLVPYSAETRRLALWIGLAVGVLTSAVGIRLLANLVAVEKAAAGRQYTWFVVVDVLFTGAVLAGGSKAVHRVSSLLEEIVKAGEAKAVKQKLVQGTPPAPPGGAPA